MKTLKSFACVFAAALMLLHMIPDNVAHANVMRVICKIIVDGDTFLLQRGTTGKLQKIRLYGIDAPELEQEYGKDSAKFLRSIAEGKEIFLDTKYKDVYGRPVAIVQIPDGRTLNEEMIRAGYAVVYDHFCKLPVCDEWKELEDAARENKLGLWAAENPMTPREWRKRNPRK